MTININVHTYNDVDAYMGGELDPHYSPMTTLHVGEIRLGSVVMRPPHHTSTFLVTIYFFDVSHLT